MSLTFLDRCPAGPTLLGRESKGGRTHSQTLSRRRPRSSWEAGAQLPPENQLGVAEPACPPHAEAGGAVPSVCDPSDPALRGCCALGRVAVKGDPGEGDVVLNVQAHRTEMADRLLPGEGWAQVTSLSQGLQNLTQSSWAGMERCLFSNRGSSSVGGTQGTRHLTAQRVAV